MRLLEADLARSWTLTGLAPELHLAPGYLVRLFNAATGLPPMAYLGQLRSEHAAVLLLHSDEPVTSIGRAVGWPDQSGFARRFKAHYGLSASAYRKRASRRDPPICTTPSRQPPDARRRAPPAGGPAVMSGFGDGPAVGLERDVVRLRAAAHAGVECVQAFELGSGELEVEHVEVLGDPFGPH